MRASFANGVLSVLGADATDFQALGRILASHGQDGDVIFLNGPLGAGKTSLAQALASGLGIQEDVVSPTFNIVFTYESGRLPLNHFDLYRLDESEQLDDVDFWGLVDEGTPGVSLIEWAELFEDEMPEDALTIQISYPNDGDATRDVRMAAAGMRAQTLLQAVAEELC